MKKRILAALLAVALLSQIPFAYRRYRLSKLRNAIQQLEGQRIAVNENEYIDYRGVIHVHTFLGGHSTGTFSELIAAAKTNALDFVIMTEHPQPEFSSSAMTLNGSFSGVLFVNGNEVVTANGDRLLLIPGSDTASSAGLQSTEVVVAKQKQSGGLSIAAYPAESLHWQTTAVDGVEVYNLFNHHNYGSYNTSLSATAPATTALFGLPQQNLGNAYVPREAQFAFRIGF